MHYHKLEKLLSRSLLLSILLGIIIGNEGILNPQLQKSGNSSVITTTGLRSAAGFNFIQIPSVSSRYISPETTPGEGDSTIYSFSVNYDANYTLDVFAYYEPIGPGGYFQPMTAYYMPNGTWIIGACSRTLILEDKWTVWVGIGTNASSLVWQLVGKANTTDNMAIAANGTSIRLVNIESDEMGWDSSSLSYKYIKYFATDDWGTTWRNGTLWDTSEWPDVVFSGVSMAAWQNTFECMWGFSNCSDEIAWLDYEMASIWESRSIGSEWSQPKNLTALLGNASYAPQVFFNQSSGNLYACVCNYTFDYKCESLLIDLGNGADAQVKDIWSLASKFGPNGFIPQVRCALDYENNNFYFNNRTGPEGICNASGWKGVIGDVDPCITEQRYTDYANLFAKGGKSKLFSGYILSNLNTYAAGILECDPPFRLTHNASLLYSAETMFYLFYGRDNNSLTHGARAYYFNLTVCGDEGRLTTALVVSVDDVPPEVQITTTHSIISPFHSFGALDSFDVNVTTTKAGTGVLTIESLDTQVNGSVEITDGLYTYSYPALCGDGINNFLFYAQSESTIWRLMLSKSSDGGLSWTTPKVLQSYVDDSISMIKARYQDQKVYCWVETDDTSLLVSPDGGENFITTVIAPMVRAVAEDLSCWHYTDNWDDPNYINISRSTDLGVTWNAFISIPKATEDEFTTCSDVAFDPISRNYSFILTNYDTNVTRFITADNNGSVYTYWDGFGDNPRGLSNGYSDNLQLDCRLLTASSSEWVITTSQYNEGFLPSGTTWLAFTTTRGDGQFSDWQNYTGISGKIINTTATPYWDILFPVNGTPCFMTGIWEFAKVGCSQIRVEYGTRVVFETRDDLSSAGSLSLSFKGLSNAMDVLPEGIYKWTLQFSDFGGQSTYETDILTVDNSEPTLGAYANLTTPNLPDPRYNTTVTVPVTDLHLSMGLLRYRTSLTGIWILIPMFQQGSGPAAANFTGTIPVLGDVTVYWEVVINDTAGNTLMVNNAGQSFTYARANIRLEEQVEPPVTLDLTGGATLEVWVIVSEDAEYIDYVSIQYQFDDGAGIHTAVMSKSGGSLYNFTITEFPANASLVQYTVIGMDLYGNQILGRTRTVSLLPALPAWEMSGLEQVAFLLVSLVVGVVCGAVYSSMIRKRTGGRILTKELVARVVEESRTQPGVELQGKPEKKTKNKVEKSSLIAIVLALTGGLAGISGAAIYLLVYQWPEAAMLCLTGTMLAMVFLWILATDSAVRRTLRANKEKISAGKIIGIFLVGLMIFASILAILYVGGMVAWWKVRVNEQAYQIFGLEIPRMLTTMMGTFFSSIILLTWSVGKDVTKTFQELHDAEINNENPGRIIALREVRMANILSAVGWKGVVFIAIIGSTLIFASDLSVYAPQGLLIIVPFVAGTVVTLAVNSLRKLKTGATRSMTPMLFDRVSKCTTCGADTPLGGAFCENCGVKVITGERVKEGEYCPACHQPTTAGVKHCRYCGNSLKVAP